MKSKINVILLGILVFVLGGVAGAISHYLYWKYNPPRPPDFTAILAKELKLDPAQKQQVAGIISETIKRVEILNQQFAPRWEFIRKEYRPQFQAIGNESDRRIKEVLREDQKVLFENFLKKRRRPPQIDADKQKKQPAPQPNPR